MPKYEAVCHQCGKVHEYKRSISERDDTPLCCAEPTTRTILTPPMGFVDTPAAKAD